MDNINVKMVMEKPEQYKKRDSSRISRVEPRKNFSSLHYEEFF